MIIVGLGNIGKEYENTRHNTGFLAIDVLADRLGVSFDKKECKASVAVCYKGGDKIVLAKPETYMNLSGTAVRELAGKYHADPSDIIIIYDDIDLDVAKIRVRGEGSGGTHNGMKNIVELMKTKAIPRIRVGIGRPTNGMDLAAYVLGRFSHEDRMALDADFSDIADSLVRYISDRDFEELKRALNR